MKIKDIRALSSEDLREKEKTLKKELFDLSYQRKLGRIEKPSRFKLIHREIARILTVINERNNEQAVVQK